MLLNDLDFRVKIGTLRKVSPGKRPGTGKGSATGQHAQQSPREPHKGQLRRSGVRAFGHERCTSKAVVAQRPLSAVMARNPEESQRQCNSARSL